MSRLKKQRYKLGQRKNKPCKSKKNARYSRTAAAFIKHIFPNATYQDIERMTPEIAQCMFFPIPVASFSLFTAICSQRRSTKND